MDVIKVSKEIDKKIKEAKAYLSTLLEIFQHQKGINLTYRIKEKNRILEKIMLFSSKPDFQNIDETEILNQIGDIIGLTIVIKTLEDTVAVANEIITQLENQPQAIRCIGVNNYINNNGGKTGYKGLLLAFKSQEGMPFEIQITDKENLTIRENTHEEFEKIKYILFTP